MQDKLFTENKQHYDDAMIRGHKKMNPCCCFDPDVLGAYKDFNYSANGYREMKYYEDYIKALDKCADCNHRLRIYFHEAKNYQDIAYIYWKKLDNFPSCVAYLRMASKAFQLDGKLMDSIDLINTFCRELIPTKEYEVCKEIISYAFNEGIKHFAHETVQIAMEETNTLLIDITSELGLFAEAIKETLRYIDVKIQQRRSKRNIFKSYIVLGILRIIIGEIYIAESLINKLYEHNENNHETINDYMKLIDSFKNEDKKTFNFCVNFTFSLLPNGLLKALRKAFEYKNKYDSFVSSDSNYVDSISGIKETNFSLPVPQTDKKFKDKLDSLFGYNNYK